MSNTMELIQNKIVVSNNASNKEWRSIGWNEFKKKYCKNHSGEHCGLCNHLVLTKHNLKNEKLNNFYQIFRDNYHCNSISKETLWQQLHEYYMKVFYWPCEKIGNPNNLPEMTPIDIKNHFLHHIHEPSVWINKNIQFYMELESLLKDKIIHEHETNSKKRKRRLDNNSLVLLNRVQSQITTFLEKNPKDMLFYNPLLHN